jgi:hypothetical protein
MRRGINAERLRALELMRGKTCRIFADVGASQAYIYAGAGLRLRRCFLVHLNRDYMRHGELKPKHLFTRRDCTREVTELCRRIEDRVAAMRRAIGKPSCPEVPIGPHCDAPYACLLRDRCWAFLSEHSVMELYRGKAKGFALLERAVARMTEIPEDCSLTENQRVQVETAKSSTPRVSKPAIRRFLQDLRYPVHFLDFETFSTAIPLFDGLRPFQRVPFQFSLHIQPSPGADLVHHRFLADGSGDPRPDFMARLRGAVAGEGSVVAYNAAFEKNVLEECAQAFPMFQPWVDSLESRFVDLLQPFGAFRYYHPAQHGSASEENPTEAEAFIAGWNFCQRHRLTVGFARVSSCSEPLSAPARSPLPFPGRQAPRKRAKTACCHARPCSGSITRCLVSPKTNSPSPAQRSVNAVRKKQLPINNCLSIASISRLRFAQEGS